MTVEQATRAPVDGYAGGYKAFFFALLVHALVILLLSVSFRWPWRAESVPENVLQAVVIKESPPPPAIPRTPPEDIERARREQEQRQKQLAALKAQEEAKRREAERQRQAKEAAERRRKEQAEKKRRAQEAAERQRQEQQQALQELLQAEEQQRVAQTQQARALALADKYKALIRQKVSRNWVRPPGAKSGMECVVRVRLVPSGEVISAEVVTSSGSAVFDRSVENAVHKAAPLPIPQEEDLFEYYREIEFQFRPEG